MSKMNIYRVISIMNHSSSDLVYDYSKKPNFVFNNNDNNQVVLCEDEWPDQLGKYVTKLDKNILFEIWQPDLRPDKIYSAEISERVYHKLFPARIKKSLSGTYLYSDKLLKEISACDDAIFQIGLPNKFYNGVLNKLKTDSKIVGTIAGEISIPYQNIWKIRKNQLRTIGHIINHFKFKNKLKRYNIINYQSNTNLSVLKKFYNGELYKITMGIDISIYKKLDKALCRKELNLNPDRKIILSVGRLNAAKQNHKLIQILNELSDNFDFLVIFIGNGDNEYEKYLKTISNKLFKKNQILFTGYIYPELLVKYYNSADVFFMSSESEGGPVVSMEALACGIPVITTDTGNVAEFILEQARNNIVGRYNYSEWKSVLMKFLNSNNIDIIDTDLAKEKYSWEPVSRKFIDIYRNI